MSRARDERRDAVGGRVLTLPLREVARPTRGEWMGRGFLALESLSGERLCLAVAMLEELAAGQPVQAGGSGRNT